MALVCGRMGCFRQRKQRSFFLSTWFRGRKCQGQYLFVACVVFLAMLVLWDNRHDLKWSVQPQPKEAIHQSKQPPHDTIIKCSKHLYGDHPHGDHDGGVIIANMNGRLGNNLFQIALAHRLACDLGWHIIYRENWQGVFPFDQRANTCFPNAMLPTTNSSNFDVDSNRTLAWFEYMNIDELSQHFWSTPSHFFHTIRVRQVNDLYATWQNATQNEGKSLRLGSPYEGKYDYTGAWDVDLVHHLQHSQEDNNANIASSTTAMPASKQTQHTPPFTPPTVRTLHLDAYFIHYEWMRPFMQEIREHWLNFNSQECCHHVPPGNAVVVHIRNFLPEEHFNPNYQTSVFVDFLNHVYFDNKDDEQEFVLWIVCQPQDVDMELVLALKQRYNATIVTGDDPYDAFCALMQARQLVLSASSTFSQMAALLSPHHIAPSDDDDDDTSRQPSSYHAKKNHQHPAARRPPQVHYLLPTLEHPHVTLVVPHWKYHLVAHDKGSIQKYSIDPATIQPIMS